MKNLVLIFVNILCLHMVFGQEISTKGTPYCKHFENKGSKLFPQIWNINESPNHTIFAVTKMVYSVLMVKIGTYLKVAKASLVRYSFLMIRLFLQDLTTILEYLEKINTINLFTKVSIPILRISRKM